MRKQLSNSLTKYLQKSELAKSRRKIKKRNMLMERLEVRSLLDGAYMQQWAVEDVAIQAEETQRVTGDLAENLVVLDRDLFSVEHIADLRSALPMHYSVETLDPKQDGVVQLGKILGNYNQLASLHLLTHGQAGKVSLGKSLIDSEAIFARHDQIILWKDSFTDRADLLLYGCNVSSANSDLASRLNQILDLDVSSSVDITGTPALGNNWKLEHQLGEIEATALDIHELIGWQGSLPTTPMESIKVEGNASDNSVTFKDGDRIGKDTATVLKPPSLISVTSSKPKLPANPERKVELDLKGGNDHLQYCGGDKTLFWEE